METTAQSRAPNPHWLPSATHPHKSKRRQSRTLPDPARLRYSICGARMGSLRMRTKRPTQLPIEILIALAINVVVAVLGYYAVMAWGLARG